MNRPLIDYNTRLLLVLFLGIFGVTLLRAALTRFGDIGIRYDNTLYGLLLFGVLFFLYQRNNLWPRITANLWVLAFCVYIALSFAYGLWRFRTPHVSVFDLWLFAFIPAILLLPAYSFNVRVFDRLVAAFVLVGFLAIFAVVAVRRDVLFDRSLFQNYSSLFAQIAAGYVYLLLKYARTANIYTYIGLFGAVSNALLYGIVGAFRGQLVLALLALLLFFIIQLWSSRVAFGNKFVTIAAGVVICSVGMFFALTRFEEQVLNVTERFTGLRDRFEERGDLVSIDGRLAEVQYFRGLNPDWKLVLGHGVGGLWYDFFGMYAQGEEAAGMAGARRTIHVNWFHLLFKIGLVGSLLLVGMLVAHYRRHPGFLRGNPSWWAFLLFYAAWTTYYGDKELTMRAIIWLMVLVHPWMFKLEGPRPPPPGALEGRKALARPPVPYALATPAMRRSFLGR